MCLLGRAAVCAGGRRPARWCGVAVWPRWCSGRRRPRPPARLGALTSFGAAPRSPPVPSGPSGALHTSGARCADDWLGASSRSPARPTGPAAASNRSAPRLEARPCPPVPPAPSTPLGPGVLVCCSSFRNFACNSPPVLCWFVSVCGVSPLVFVNCMRLLLSAGPAAHRHHGQADWCSSYSMGVLRHAKPSTGVSSACRRLGWRHSPR